VARNEPARLPKSACLAAVISLVLASCANSSDFSYEEGNNVTLGGLTMLLSAEGPSGDMALLTGELRSVGGCLSVGRAKSSVFVVWPRGFGLTKQDGTVWITDASGALVARMGDQLRLSGGITTLKDAQSIVPGGIPASCAATGPDAYWISGNPEQDPSG
jgi:hypothetical protein